MDSERRKANLELQNASSQHENAGTGACVNANSHDILKSEIMPECNEDSCSTSSSSSTSSDEDFFQFEVGELGKSNSMPDNNTIRNNMQPPLLALINTQLETGMDFTYNPGVKNGRVDQSLAAGPVWLGKEPISAPLSACSGSSPGSDSFGTVGIKQSPPIQIMGRQDVPDPNRIPASVFARTKSTTPMEWSLASNESLFSIHAGKSGDLTGIYNSGQLDCYSPIFSHHIAYPAKSAGFGPSLQPTAESELETVESMKNIVKPTIVEHGTKENSSGMECIPHSDSTSQLSDGGSINSHRSFAFPILNPEGRNVSSVGESVRPLPKTEQTQTRAPQPETPEGEQQQAESPKAEPAVAHSTWFRWPSCSCCPFLCFR